MRLISRMTTIIISRTSYCHMRACPIESVIVRTFTSTELFTSDNYQDKRLSAKRLKINLALHPRICQDLSSGGDNPCNDELGENKAVFAVKPNT